MREVREALLLRSFALGLLLGPMEERVGRPAGSSSAPVPDPPGASPPAWRLFLEAERCALPLLGALERSSAPRPEAAAVAALRERAALEARRVLSVRSQLSEVGRVAVGRGLEVVVLKGAVPLARGEPPLALGDLDLLVRPEAVGALEAALREAGYRARVHGAPAHHLPPRGKAGHAPVEIHRSLEKTGEPVPEAVWRRTGAIPGGSGLRCLAPEDQLWHVLVHSVGHHLHRRGRLRDLLLVRGAVRRCGPEGRRAVDARISAHPFREALAAQLAMATGTTADLFRAEAASHYLLWRLLPLWPGKRWSVVQLFDAAAARLAGAAEREHLWRATGRLSGGLSGYRWVRALERLPGGLGEGWRKGLRRVRHGLVAGAALPVAAWARRTARRQPDRPSPA